MYKLNCSPPSNSPLTLPRSVRSRLCRHLTLFRPSKPLQQLNLLTTQPFPRNSTCISTFSSPPCSSPPSRVSIPISRPALLPTSQPPSLTSLHRHSRPCISPGREAHRRIRHRLHSSSHHLHGAWMRALSPTRGAREARRAFGNLTPLPNPSAMLRAHCTCVI